MRIVIKIGTSTLAHPTGHLNIRRVEQLCKIMSDIKNAGHELILVSSGAIGMGVGKLGALPVINENDTVATDEIVIGDNDTLAAIVARSVHADMLILLSDIDGLYTADPHTHPEATLLHHVARVDDHIREIAGISSSTQGTGGMVTKLHAADICLGCGCKMVIANGNNPGNLYDILEGKTVGTTFSEERL